MKKKKQSRKPARPSLRCRRLLRHLSDYVDGELDPSICETIETHMPGCRACRAFIASLRKTIRIEKAVGRLPKPSASQRRALAGKLRDCLRSRA